MCGIFGWLLSANQAQDRASLERQTDHLAHRGPDGFGGCTFITADEGHQIGFGHRRLSIIDIAGGAQPMATADGRIHVTYNGEIYNYIELRDELAALGSVFHTTSDTEVLLEAYRVWGLNALDKLRGMFAFALWDAGEQKLLLARDPFGKKPLFIADRRGGLVFASEIPAILDFAGFDRALNPEAFEHYLVNRYVPGPDTFFRGIRKLSPGCFALWQKGQVQTTRYFTPPIATTQPDIFDLEEATEIFSTVFDDSVRIRMRSDAPFGAYLSGGIDSSAVVAAMTRHATSKVRTFSVGFREAAYSELDQARAVAQHFDCDHHEVVVDAETFLREWPTAILRRGAPVSEASDVPILMLSKMASSTVKMVLTGEGSDELLGGYPKHRAERWQTAYQSIVPKPVHDSVVAALMRRLPYGMRRVKTLFNAFGEYDFQDRMRSWFGGIPLGYRDALLGPQRNLAPPDPFPFAEGISSATRRMLFFDQTSWLPDNLLERGDRMMMAGSIEGRMPFMDVELARTVARLPDRFLIGCPGGKRVLRRAFRNRLPEHIRKRKKVGFRVPVNEWFRGPYRAILQETLTTESSEIRRHCSPVVLDQLVAEHLSGRQNHEKILWSLLNFEMFVKTFKLTGL